MKRYFISPILFIWGLILVLTGCGTGAPDTEKPPIPINNLINAAERFPDDDIIMDDIIKSTEENNLTNISIMYPSKWPSEYIADIIPEYSGTGYMYILFVTSPTIYSTAPDKAEVVSLSIYEYNESDIVLFVDELTMLGFVEVPKSEFSERERYLLDNNLVNGLSIYETDNCRVRIFLNHDDLGDYLQFTFIMLDRINLTR